MRIKQGNSSIGYASNHGLPRLWHGTWTICVHACGFFLFCSQFSNMHPNYVTCVLSKLQTITKGQIRSQSY